MIPITPTLDDLTPEQIATLPRDVQARILPLIRRRRELVEQRKARTNFYDYCQYIDRGYVKGNHLELLTAKLQEVAEGKVKRLIVCMPPRHSKSRHASELFPGYYLGHHPSAPVMVLSHTLNLSKKFGRSIRDYIALPEYNTIFPETQLRADQTAVGEWGTTRGAQFFAAGVGGAIAGRGAGLLIVDDMVNDQDALLGQTRPEIFEGIYDWYLLARQRLMPGGAVVIVNTRWAPNDPTGLIMERSKEDWEVITLPAIWPKEDPDNPDETERTLWPQFWKPEEIFALRDEMPPLKWEATYQQNPTAGGATIVQPDWIQVWPSPTPPKLSELIITIDSAFSEKTRADPTGVLIGGIFEAARGTPGGRPASDDIDRPRKNAIVIDYMDTRQNFPDLKTTVESLYREYRPDAILIEDKATGVPLYQELALLNLPVQLFKIARGTRAAPNDKIARYTSVSGIIKEGRFWVPSPEHCEWSEAFQRVLTNFPMVSNDEAVDCVTMLLTYFRNLGELVLKGELREFDEDNPDTSSSYRFGGYQAAMRRGY